MGRPTKLTPKVRDAICEGIRLGMTYKHAAMAAGITERTFYHWVERGKNGDEPYAQFLQALSGAEAEGIRKNLDAIQGASEKDWRAAAWLLERRHPAEYGRREEVTHAGAVRFDYVPLEERIGDE